MEKTKSFVNIYMGFEYKQLFPWEDDFGDFDDGVPFAILFWVVLPAIIVLVSQQCKTDGNYKWLHPRYSPLGAALGVAGLTILKAIIDQEGKMVKLIGLAVIAGCFGGPKVLEGFFSGCIVTKRAALS